jgi:cellobiose phosphorylase
MTQYGRFTADGTEYVLTHPRTPRPWHNFLFNDTYLVNLTQHGTGSSFFQPRGEGLRANVTEDRDGNGGPRYVYLRDNDSGAYWSLTGAPDFRDQDEWQCRVGLGYQIHSSRVDGIRASWRVFVPRTADPVEIWTVEVTNLTKRRRRISVFPYLEAHLTGGSTLMDFISVLGGHYDPRSRAVFAINSCVKFPPYFKAFLASDTPVAAATVSRDEFVGPYRDYHNPLAVETGNVHNPQAGTEWLGASLKHDWSLKPGQTVTLHCAIGVVSSVEEGRTRIREYLRRGRPEALFNDVLRAARDMNQRITVHTSDPQFDRWMNVWLKHQLTFVARWGRVIGRGFRDILQDTFAHRLTEPAKARECIREVFSKQFPSGKCIRAWHLPIAILDLQDYADSPSWMVMALAFYLKETGDFALLDEQVPFLNPKDPYAKPTSSATVWDHVLLAQRHLLKDLGRHGLSKIHYGDWCDTMNGVGTRGRGESVMLAMQVKWGCDLLAELAGVLNRKTVAREMNRAAARLTRSIEKHAWDGNWYVRAFDDEGIPVGSHTPPPSDQGEGRIFMNPQSWALIADLGRGRRQQSAVRSAKRYLDTGYGMVLSYPAFTGLKPRIGQITAQTPGFYENASVYVHGNCFWIYGLAKAGFADDAFRAFKAVLPDTPNKPNADTEPFVIPNFYIGPNVARRKQRNLYLSGWRTGSAAWVYMTGLEELLGVRAEYDGLRLDPHLPTAWKQARVRRPFRGDIYEVRIRRDGRGSRVRQVLLDGKPIRGTMIKPVGDGRTHRVDVRVG